MTKEKKYILTGCCFVVLIAVIVKKFLELIKNNSDNIYFVETCNQNKEPEKWRDSDEI